MLEELARKTDLDLGEVRTFLTNEGPLGFSGLRNQDADAFMYRFMTAWDQRDLQGVLDAMSVGQRAGLYLSERTDDLVKWAEANAGTAKHLSDLADGATVGRARGEWWHPPSYYAEFSERRSRSWLPSQDIDFMAKPKEPFCLLCLIGT